MARKRYKVTFNYKGEVFVDYTMATTPKHALLNALGARCEQLRQKTVTGLYNYFMTTGNSYKVEECKD